LRVGDAVAIIGPGALGLASIIVAAHMGAGAIIAVGLRADQRRLEFARRCGATHVVIADEEDAVAATRAHLGGELPALSVDATGSPAGLLAALSLVRPGGKCVLGGTVGKATPIMTDLIVRNEIQVFGALGQPRDVEPALKIIETNRYPIGEIVERTYPLEQAEAALKAFIAAPQECIRVAIQPL
jgi:threonine dehydrogenase-like Zn-dependent dehydrogenase